MPGFLVHHQLLELGQVAAVARVTGCHHVLGIEHLLGELGDGQRPVLLAAAGSEGGKAG